MACLFRTLLVAFAEFERERIAERRSEGQAKTAMKGIGRDGASPSGVTLLAAPEPPSEVEGGVVLWGLALLDDPEKLAAPSGGSQNLPLAALNFERVLPTGYGLLRKSPTTSPTCAPSERMLTSCLLRSLGRGLKLRR